MKKLIKPFIFNQWHVWDNLNNAFLLSNEETKDLKQFKTLDDCVNYLYLIANDKMAARELNKAMREYNV